MAVFRAFKPEAMNKIAKSMGYTGNMAEFQDFIEQDPARKARMQQFTNAAVQMAKGGVVKMREGGMTLATQTGFAGRPGATPEQVSFLAGGNQGQFAPGTLAQAQNQMQLQQAPGFSGIPQITPRPGGETIASQASYGPAFTVPNPALRQAYVPTQEFKKVTKPKMDTNEFLADGETPNPNYMKPITDPDGNVVTEEVAPTIADI